MRYAEYSYYTDNYLSGRTALISASDFDYYAEQAGIWLSHYTYGNIENVKDIPDKVKQCTCAIAEKMCRYDLRKLVIILCHTKVALHRKKH